MKVVVAMSGGVDSSVVAGLLVEAGHEVIGLAMKTHSEAPKQNRACCTPDDMRDARRVADALDIPFYVLNYTGVFIEEIIQPFVQSYRQGLTPNPCVDCNDKVKFRPMLERARQLGADALATGHYARVEGGGGEPYRLLRGVDRQKDQSYFLYRLQQDQLGRLMFPLGAMTKAEVREHARRLGLPVADKHESQEICFVGAEGYAALVEKMGGPMSAGDIVDASGQVVGRHHGIHHYTLGQRRGLGISAAEPQYVTGLDPLQHRVHVGPKSALQAEQVQITDVVWASTPPGPEEVLTVRQRYREAPQPARVVVSAAGVTAHFTQPVLRGAPGQAAVIYRGDEVVGGGRIAPKRGALPVLQPDTSVGAVTA